MAQSARYFLSRITVRGLLDKDRISDALLKAESIQARIYAWTIVDAQSGIVGHNRREYPYISGNLAKYDPEAVVETVDSTNRRVVLRQEPDLLRAASQFVYFPDEAAFAHRHIWNEITAPAFRNNTSQLIEAYYGKFFVECDIEPITDYQQFVTKLGRLEQIRSIKASVSPPNPLFSPFWGALKAYLDERNTKKLKIHEESAGPEGLNTQVGDIARQILEEDIEGEHPAAIGDAAVLLAADGYGHAEVSGERDNTSLVVKTSDNVIEFKLDSDANAEMVAKTAIRVIHDIQTRRKLSH